MTNCTLTYVTAFIVFIVVAVIFHFYVVAPFLIGMFRGQQEGELLALIANNPRQRSKLQAAFPVTGEDVTTDTTFTTSSKAQTTKSSELVRPVESVLSFFENRKKNISPS